MQEARHPGHRFANLSGGARIEGWPASERVARSGRARFGVDIPPAPAGQALPVGGGDPGKVLTSFITAAQRKNWPAIKATLSPAAVEDFERSYNTPAENAAGVAQLAELWFPKDKLKITGGQLRGEKAVLEVEGETFPGMNSMTFVEMVKTGTAWKFERAIRFGIVPTK